MKVAYNAVPVLCSQVCSADVSFLDPKKSIEAALALDKGFQQKTCTFFSYFCSNFESFL